MEPQCISCSRNNVKVALPSTVLNICAAEVLEERCSELMTYPASGLDHALVLKFESVFLSGEVDGAHELPL